MVNSQFKWDHKPIPPWPLDRRFASQSTQPTNISPKKGNATQTKHTKRLQLERTEYPRSISAQSHQFQSQSQWQLSQNTFFVDEKLNKKNKILINYHKWNEWKTVNQRRYPGRLSRRMSSVAAAHTVGQFVGVTASDLEQYGCLFPARPNWWRCPLAKHRKRNVPTKAQPFHFHTTAPRTRLVSGENDENAIKRHRKFTATLGSFASTDAQLYLDQKHKLPAPNSKSFGRLHVGPVCLLLEARPQWPESIELEFTTKILIWFSTIFSSTERSKRLVPLHQLDTIKISTANMSKLKIIFRCFIYFLAFLLFRLGDVLTFLARTVLCRFNQNSLRIGHFLVLYIFSSKFSDHRRFNCSQCESKNIIADT